MRPLRKVAFQVSVVRCLTLIVALRGLSTVTRANWKTEWEKTLSAAKMEGQVTVYMKVGYDAVLRAFRKQYPDIKIVSVAGQTRHITQRILAERRAGKNIPNVYSAGVRSTNSLYKAKALNTIKPALILPEVTDKSKWRRGHFFSDPERKHIFNYLSAVSSGSAHFNVNLVNPKEFDSYWDFLEPKWKGKIEARDIRTPGPGNANMLFFTTIRSLGQSL